MRPPRGQSPRMKSVLSWLAVALLLASCAAPQPPPRVTFTDHDVQFDRLADEFISGWLAWRPQLGTALGLHAYDGRVTDFSRASLDAELARLKRFEERLVAAAARPLGPRARHDLRLLQTAVRGELFQFEDAAAFRRNPMTYAGVLDVNIYIKRNFAPIGQRVRSITSILAGAPALFAAARANLDAELPRPFVETAIEIATAGADFLAKDLVAALEEVHDESLMAAFAAANTNAVAELRGFASWLEKERLPRATAGFALGREKFARMLRVSELIEPAPDELLAVAMRELQREQAVFAATAKLIAPDKPAIEVFKAIQKDHPTEAGLIPDTRRNLEAIRRFCVDRDVITFPSAVRARVEETPAFLRATSFASMDTPGPFETTATEAYYYVTPTEKDWPAAQKEEWLTAFNYYTTDVVSIHEAYPGHYAQFLHLNASQATAVEKVFTSYAFVEGWAHYTEQMLLDEGFPAPRGPKPTVEDTLRAAKYRLAQSDEALLRLCRFVCAIRMHCEGMSVEDATRFFQANCYYEAKPAQSEATRGTYDPGYCLYTIGKLQILKLRADWQAQEGAKYSLRRFHDTMLGFGAPPVRLLRERMLKDPAKWAEVF
ncbi:MAG: DUF885 domain-containing protein [Verrucomicrobia bacterium]|nr:DUF885 domain-containing protein [Verrucomicrobiota bacterium]